MNEVEKMYENANIKAKEYCDRDSDACMTCCPEWENRQDCWKYKSVMPPFTAEKQLELIKWLAKRQDFGLNYYPNSKVWDAQTQFCWEFYCKTYEHKEFEQALAGLINNLWQDLTDTEKAEIKEILECSYKEK